MFKIIIAILPLAFGIQELPKDGANPLFGLFIILIFSIPSTLLIISGLKDMGYISKSKKSTVGKSKK